MSTENAAAIKETESALSQAGQTGFFNLSSIAKQRVSEKRKRKGLGELKPREKSVYR